MWPSMPDELSSFLYAEIRLDSTSGLRKDLIRQLVSIGCVLVRHGGKYDWYQNPTTKVSQPVPRHAEINEHLAKRILKIMSDP